jgi:hypothetical protein
MFQHSLSIYICEGCSRSSHCQCVKDSWWSWKLNKRKSSSIHSDYTQTHKYISPNSFKQAKLLQLWNLLRKGVMPIIPLKRGKLHITTFPRGEAWCCFFLGSVGKALAAGHYTLNLKLWPQFLGWNDILLTEQSLQAIDDDEALQVIRMKVAMHAERK